MIWKFFTLKVVESNGLIHKATFKEKIQWLLGGCHLRDEKVCRRFSKMKLTKNHQS